MSSQSSKNVVSPIIFAAFAAMMVFVVYLLVRGFLGIGVFHPGFLAKLLLVLLGVLVLGVWGTLAFVGYQLLKISRNQ